MTVSQLYEIIDREVAPFCLQEDWDNSGLLVGDGRQEITAALVCLDIIPGAVEEALRRGANVLVSHHPVIFHPLKSVTEGGIVPRLIRAGLSCLCAHTNLDAAEGGVNDCLARALALRDCAPLAPVAGHEGYALGRVGALPQPMAPRDFARYVDGCLSPAGGVRYVDAGRTVARVAVCGGAGGFLAGRALEKGADALVTGELSHDACLSCAAMGLTAVDAGHFDTERVVLAPLAERLAQLAPGTAFVVSRQESPVRRV